jgi:outer membrane protein
MNNTIKTLISILTVVSLFPGNLNAGSQQNQDSITFTEGDSLSLNVIIQEIVKDHPSVREAEEALMNADARIGLARTGYYPVIDASASFSNIGPVLKFTIPQMGTIQLYPENNYSGSVNYRQVIYDFGRTRQNIDIEKENKTIGGQALEQVKQKMSLAAVNSFYTIAYLQEAVRIKDEQLAALEEHLRYIRTMKATGSATDYQILSTEVRISTAESQKVDLLASLDIQQAYLGALLGKEDFRAVVRKELDIELPAITPDSLQQYALLHRDEMIISKERASLAGLRYELLRTVNRPLLSMAVSGGAKNGYQPDLNVLKANYSAGIGISVPIFDGMKTKYNLMQAKSAINTAEYETENTRRNISAEIKEAQSYLESGRQKVTQSILQLDQAQKAYSLAETSFRAGTITNLELLDANTAVSESRLMLLKARIDYAASIYRLKAALGERLY